MTDSSFEKLQALLSQCMALFEEEKAARESEQSEELKAEENSYGLEVYFIDVGQGDATLIKCGENAMLIDAGNNTKGTKVRKFLKDHGVEKIDYLVGTHPGADHIGGLDSVLYNMPCEHLFLSDKAPAEAMETESYQDVLSAAAAKNMKVEMPKINEKYLLGDSEFQVISPAISYTDSNDASLVIRLTFGTTSFLFMGDATNKAEAVLLASCPELKSNVLKVGHHGSSEATCDAFLEAVAPMAGIISCGENNTYGHPAEDLLERLQKNNVKIFRTDQQGNVTVVSDGSRILWKTEKTTTVITTNESSVSQKSEAQVTTKTNVSATEKSAAQQKENLVQKSSGSVQKNASASVQKKSSEEKEQKVFGEAKVLSTGETPDKDELYCSYVVNMNSYVFHRPGCHHLKHAARRNLAPSTFTYDRCVASNYVPCISCMP